jgi:hypothetical protein
MKTLSATPRPYDRWKAENLSFLHVLLVWGVTVTSLLIKKRQSWGFELRYNISDGAVRKIDKEIYSRLPYHIVKDVVMAGSWQFETPFLDFSSNKPRGASPGLWWYVQISIGNKFWGPLNRKKGGTLRGLRIYHRQRNKSSASHMNWFAPQPLLKATLNWLSNVENSLQPSITS